MGRVILTQAASTVHFKMGEPVTAEDGSVYEPHEVRVVAPGEIIDPNLIPNYLLDLVKKGKAPGLVLLTEAQAKKVQREAAIARGEVDLVAESGLNLEEENLAEATV